MGKMEGKNEAPGASKENPGERTTRNAAKEKEKSPGGGATGWDLFGGEGGGGQPTTQRERPGVTTEKESRSSDSPTGERKKMGLIERIRNIFMG